MTLQPYLAYVVAVLAILQLVDVSWNRPRKYVLEHPRGAVTAEVKWLDSYVGFSSQEELAKFEAERAEDIANLSPTGTSNFGSDWIYLGQGVLQNANNQAGYDWQNKVTGEVSSGIGAKPPDSFIIVEQPK